MTASAIPCSAQVRRSTTRDLSGPPTFHTPAGAAAWQIGQREAVRLRRVSVGRRVIMSDSRRLKCDQAPGEGDDAIQQERAEEREHGQTTPLARRVARTLDEKGAGERADGCGDGCTARE